MRRPKKLLTGGDNESLMNDELLALHQLALNSWCFLFSRLVRSFVEQICSSEWEEWEPGGAHRSHWRQSWPKRQYPLSSIHRDPLNDPKQEEGKRRRAVVGVKARTWKNLDQRKSRVGRGQENGAKKWRQSDQQKIEGEKTRSKWMRVMDYR